MSSQFSSHSKSSLFLIELIISLFFFSLASVVCVRMFLYAHSVSTDSRVETLAIQRSQTAAECFIAADGEETEFLKLWNLVGSGSDGEIDTAFTVSETPDASGGAMCRLQIRNTLEDGTELFSLDVLHYRPEGGAE